MLGAVPAPVSPELLSGMRSAARELVGGSPARRCWSRENRCWVEVRGLAADPDHALAQEVVAALKAVPGVQSARVNLSVSRVIVTVEPGETPDVDALCDAVAASEARLDTAAYPPADLPCDSVALGGRLIATAATGAGFCVAAAGRILLWPALPSGVVAVIAAIDYQPRLRQLVEERLGPDTADTALALAAASVYTLTQSPSSLAVEFFRHLSQVGELLAAQQAWQRRAPDLTGRTDTDDLRARPQRPCPMPPGPLERHAERSGVAQGLAATSVGLLTRDVNSAATSVVVTAPKAARNAREAFASTLGRGLADRHDVLTLRPDSLRTLDRIDTVVIDPRVLLTDRLRVISLRDVADHERTQAWQWAQEHVRDGTLDAGWHLLPAPVLARRNGHPAAAALVGHVHHPQSAGLVGEIRRADLQAVSVAGDELDDLGSSFDELYPVTTSIDDALREAVVVLQTEGRTVAVLSAEAVDALLAADLAVGLPAADRCPPWCADILVPDLDAAWRLVHAIPRAHRASRRGVELSTSATILGAVLMIPGVSGRGPGPVTAGAAAGLATGLWLARATLADSPPVPAPTREWHAMSADEVRRELPPPEHSVSERRSRLAATADASATALGNVIGPPLRLAGEIGASVREELSDPLTPVLAVGSAASALLGSPIDAILVGSVLTGNAILAASQQVRAERLLRRLLAVQDPPARLLPGGDAANGYRNVDAVGLLPGDVVEVRSGEVVPADCRIVEAFDIEVDESALTGESLPVTKETAATPGAAVAERTCMLYASTTVVAGSAIAVVTATGAQTQVRRAAEIAPTQSSTVGLQAQLRDLTNRALPFSLAGGALVSGLGVLRGVPLRQAVASGVAVAVAAVPEGLPLVATLAQQASARRLSRAGALVRSPRSVEALGRVDVVCFDKTGTLSENRLRVSRVAPADGFTDAQVLSDAARATPPRNGDRHEHATDAAVVEAAGTTPGTDGIHLPFRSGRPFSACIQGNELVIKGAPEVVLEACRRKGTGTDHQVRAMAGSGLRVIAVARRTVTAAQAGAARADDKAFVALCRGGLTLEGLVGISDTPRQGAAQLLATLQGQQVGVRLVTGDHPVTAAAIATELGLAVTVDEVITGTRWESMSRRGQESAVQDNVVFARMTPEHKVQVVQTLERVGQVCAMVGDGANDAAAIRSATVGIGVASRGSDPARTAADVMLLDGRIEALSEAVDEGRELWRRVQAAVAVLLGGNAGEVAFTVIGSALTGRSPLNTRQLLLVNMLTDALPAAALAVSPAAGVDRSSGRGPDQAALWRTVAIRGTTTAAAATTAWVTAGFSLRPRRASTVALIALVSTQLGQTLIDSHSPLVVSTAAGSLLTMGALISTPGVSQLLGCTPLGPVGWTQALGTAGVATAAAVVAPRVLARFQSSMSSTPSRHSTAYTSRNGIATSWDSADTESEETLSSKSDTDSTVHTAGV